MSEKILNKIITENNQAKSPDFLKWIFKISSLVKFRLRLGEIFEINKQNNNPSEFIRTIEVLLELEKKPFYR